jgi:hypothetical protein
LQAPIYVRQPSFVCDIVHMLGKGLRTSPCPRIVLVSIDGRRRVMSLRYLASQHWVKVSAMVLTVMSAKSIRAEMGRPRAVSDHAVPQRERPIYIWSWAKPGIHLPASLDQQVKLASADVLKRRAFARADVHLGCVFQDRGNAPKRNVQPTSCQPQHIC